MLIFSSHTHYFHLLSDVENLNLSIIITFPLLTWVSSVMQFWENLLIMKKIFCFVMRLLFLSCHKIYILGIVQHLSRILRFYFLFICTNMLLLKVVNFWVKRCIIYHLLKYICFCFNAFLNEQELSFVNFAIYSILIIIGLP